MQHAFRGLFILKTFYDYELALISSMHVTKLCSFSWTSVLVLFPFQKQLGQYCMNLQHCLYISPVILLLFFNSTSLLFQDIIVKILIYLVICSLRVEKKNAILIYEVKYLDMVLLKGIATIWGSSPTGIKKPDISGYFDWEESKGIKLFSVGQWGVKIWKTSALLLLV